MIVKKHCERYDCIVDFNDIEIEFGKYENLFMKKEKWNVNWFV